MFNPFIVGVDRASVFSGAFAVCFLEDDVRIWRAHFEGCQGKDAIDASSRRCKGTHIERCQRQ
jgi:hypothetical protein